MPIATVAADPPPLAATWTGPAGGVPPLATIGPADLEPALEAAMAEQLRAIAQIGADPEPPTFANTSLPLERAARTLRGVRAVYDAFCNARADDAVRAVERRMAPRLAAFDDAIVQDAALFARVKAVFEGRDRAGLEPEARRLAWKQYTDLVRAGAALDAGAQAELAAINAELATAYTTFSQNVLADEESAAVFIADESGLDGLPEDVRGAAAAAAAARGQPGRWAIPNTRSSVEAFLTMAQNRPLRERVWRMFVDRGAGGGATDNHATVARILALRARRARLLGFPTHAHWRLEDSMAGTPERALQLLERLWGPAVARVRRDVAAMQALADAEGTGVRIAPWDYRFYAERLRRERFGLDDAEVAPYLQLDRLREGMFFVAGELFGLGFRPVAPGTVPVLHPDVRVWEVRRADDDRLLGLFYFDPFARPGKRSGAWMSDYRGQERLDGAVLPLVSNTCNFAAPAPGEPAMLSWDDATTLFHEFGHALHGLLSDVTYPTLAGTNVARDFVELPSQLLEHWLSTPEILDRYARHVRTGAPLPRELAERIRRAATSDSGFRTVEFLASALVDLRLHLAATPPTDPARFERETLAALGMPAEIVMRHRTPHFAHVFADDGYSAGYYSYLWADVLTADAWEAFTEAGGAWDRGVAERFRRHVLAAGNSVDPADAYRGFRGRDADVDALLRKRGFVDPPAADR